jgi:adenylate cyclase
MGEITYHSAKHEVEARLLDKLIVKGKTKPILLYELLGKKGELDDARRKACEMYEQALRAHWAREWDAAEALLKEALALDPNDGPCARLLARLDVYKAAPPEDAWNGEYIGISKD